MSCFGGRDERIYLAEILIDRLTLTPGKIKDIGEHPIVIKIKLLDLPVLEIAREGSDAPWDVRFAIGKCCLFVAQPRDLVRGLRSTSLKIGVFRAGDTYPTAETELTLPGCLCDQISMVDNDPANLPKPFTVKGGFHLLDPGENPSGTLYMELAVACLGRVFAAPLELRAASPVIGEAQDKEVREVYVRRVVPSEFLAEKPIPQPLQEILLAPEAAKPPAKKVKAAKKKKGKK